MKLLKIANGKEIKVDDDVFEIVSKYKWFEFQNSIRRARRKADPSHYPKEVVLSRFIMGMDCKRIYFKDRDNTNHQRSNLWVANSNQMMLIRQKRTKNRILPKGVTKNKNSNTYTAKINGTYLGCFPTAFDAAHCYRTWELKLYPNLARTDEDFKADIGDLKPLDLYLD